MKPWLSCSRPPMRMPGSTRRDRVRKPSSASWGHALMENRNGLVVDACLTVADGHAERVAALHMIEPRADRPQAITLGADKAYDAEDFINELRSMRVTLGSLPSQTSAARPRSPPRATTAAMTPSSRSHATLLQQPARRRAMEQLRYCCSLQDRCQVAALRLQDYK